MQFLVDYFWKMVEQVYTPRSFSAGIYEKQIRLMLNNFWQYIEGLFKANPFSEEEREAIIMEGLNLFWGYFENIFKSSDFWSQSQKEQMNRLLTLFWKYTEEIFQLKFSRGKELEFQQIFPEDFKTPIDQGGPGEGKPLGGFGGDPLFNREQHQKQLKRTPVILVHGNAGSAYDDIWGMLTLKDRLLAAGYEHSEVWALSYLGKGELDLSAAHRDNVEDLRLFVAAVRDYLNVEKVDVIAHSIGVTLTRAWLKGYRKIKGKGVWSKETHYEELGSFVALAGANQGITSLIDEWDPEGAFMQKLNEGDQTPFGEGDEKTLPDGSRITYVALWGEGELIDAQKKNTASLKGADLNKKYDLGSSFKGHASILKDGSVFADILPFLNKVGVVKKK